MLGVFTNNLALTFKYAKYEQYLQVKDNQYIVVFCKSFALSFNVLLSQKLCYKRVICMPLARYCMVIAAQKYGSCGKNQAFLPTKSFFHQK